MNLKSIAEIIYIIIILESFIHKNIISLSVQISSKELWQS